MHRFRSLSLAGLCTLFALAPAAVSGQPPAPLRATLYTNVVQWSTTPGTQVRVVLRGPERVKATVTATANENGEVNAVFPFGGGGGDNTIRPGDQIGIHPSNGVPFTKTVPAMSAALDYGARTVSGQAPPMARLVSTVYGPDDRALHSEMIDVDAQGAYEWPIPPGVDLSIGSYGTMVLALMGGDPWTVRWDVLAAQCTIGSSAVTGRATLGTTVRLRLEAGGSTKATTGQNPTTVLRTPNFNLNFRQGNNTVPVAVDDTVIVEHNGQPTLRAVAPAVSVEIDAERDQVVGTAPPNAPLLVTATTSRGRTASVSTTSDTTGYYEADFGGQLDLGPGTIVYTTWTDDRIAFRTLGVLEQVVATLYGAQVSGTAPQRVAVTANLYAPDGTLLASGSGNAGSGGTFQFNLTEPGGTTAVRMAPGQRLEVTIAERPTIVLRLPEITAQADAERDRVRGNAPANAPVWVTLAGSGGATAATAETVADANGRYEVSFAGQADIVPGSTGSVAVGLPGGHAVMMSWALPRVAVTLGNATVSGIGPAGRTVTVALRRGGTLVASGRTDVGAGGFGGSSNWSVSLAAPGSPTTLVAVEAGDQLDVEVADWSLSLVVPNVTVEVDPEADTVSGVAPAGRSVRVTVARGNASETLTVQADPSGHYEANFAGRWDIATGDTATSQVTLDGGHTVSAEGGALDVTVFLRTGVVSGRATRNATVRATLRSAAGSQRASGQTQAGGNGRFELQLADSAGQPVAPNAGDVLRLEFGSTAVEMTIPLLTVSYDLDSDTIRGQATPGGRIVVRASGVMGPSQTFEVTPGPDGRYQLALAGRFDLRAGTLLEVSYLTGEGLTARIDERVPIGHVQLGGNLVSGYAAPNASVQVRLERSGATIASGSVTAGADGAFSLRLMTPTLQPQRIEAGDRVTIRWPAGSALQQASGEIAITVSRIDATIDVASRTVAGTTSPNTTVVLRRTMGGGEYQVPVVSDAQGNFSQTLPGSGTLAAGFWIEVGVFDNQGHRSYLLVIAPYLEAYLGTNRVDGQASPLVDLRLRLGEGGTTIGQAQLTSSAIGDFSAQLEAVGSGEALVLTGRRLELTEPRSGVTTIDIPELSIELDRAAARLQGTAPPNVSVPLRLFPPGREPIDRQTRSNEQGRWSFTDRDLPRGADFSIADLVRAEARLSVGNGHRVVAATGGPVPTPAPSPTATAMPPRPTATAAPPIGGIRLYLPHAHNNSR